MNDASIIKIARCIDRLNYQISKLVTEIQESGHPNADALVKALQDNSFDNPAWATHVIAHDLEHPEMWETGYYGHVPPNGIRKKRKQARP